ncbi:hypothetical protein [Paraflavitalea speifideaquila]|uniref:hypothetical protein n=1 Tax=Paraflavitalea speifideaquila TaxID=3076558 RepID=UPI0028E96A52|nr:hypothetical protein [Paraflavitalea speifideiaquila]
MRFRLILAELKDGQTAIQALSNSVPVINQADLLSNNLAYPAQLPDLVLGKICVAGNSLYRYFHHHEI